MKVKSLNYLEYSATVKIEKINGKYCIVKIK